VVVAQLHCLQFCHFMLGVTSAYDVSFFFLCLFGHCSKKVGGLAE